MQKVEEILTRSKNKTTKINKELLRKELEIILENLFIILLLSFDNLLTLFLNVSLRDLTETPGTVSLRMPRPPSMQPSTSATS